MRFREILNTFLGAGGRDDLNKIEEAIAAERVELGKAQARRAEIAAEQDAAILDRDFARHDRLAKEHATLALSERAALNRLPVLEQRKEVAARAKKAERIEALRSEFRDQFDAVREAAFALVAANEAAAALWDKAEAEVSGADAGRYLARINFSGIACRDLVEMWAAEIESSAIGQSPRGARHRPPAGTPPQKSQRELYTERRRFSEPSFHPHHGESAYGGLEANSYRLAASARPNRKDHARDGMVLVSVLRPGLSFPDGHVGRPGDQIALPEADAMVLARNGAVDIVAGESNG